MVSNSFISVCVVILQFFFFVVLDLPMSLEDSFSFSALFSAELMLIWSKLKSKSGKSVPTPMNLLSDSVIDYFRNICDSYVLQYVWQATKNSLGGRTIRVCIELGYSAMYIDKFGATGHGWYRRFSIRPNCDALCTANSPVLFRVILRTFCTDPGIRVCPEHSQHIPLWRVFWNKCNCARRDRDDAAFHRESFIDISVNKRFFKDNCTTNVHACVGPELNDKHNLVYDLEWAVTHSSKRHVVYAGNVVAIRVRWMKWWLGLV